MRKEWSRPTPFIFQRNTMQVFFFLAIFRYHTDITLYFLLSNAYCYRPTNKRKKIRESTRFLYIDEYKSTFKLMGALIACGKMKNAFSQICNNNRNVNNVTAGVVTLLASIKWNEMIRYAPSHRNRILFTAQYESFASEILNEGGRHAALLQRKKKLRRKTNGSILIIFD